MALNGSRQAKIERRRQHVARLRLHGLSMREIAEALHKLAEEKPDEFDACSLGIVHKDIKAIEAEWREEAKRDIAEHKARQVAELGEVKRVAHGKLDLFAIIAALKHEAKLLGLEAPERHEHKHDVADTAADRLLGVLGGIAARRETGSGDTESDD